MLLFIYVIVPVFLEQDRIEAKIFISKYLPQIEKETSVY